MKYHGLLVDFSQNCIYIFVIFHDILNITLTFHEMTFTIHLSQPSGKEGIMNKKILTILTVAAILLSCVPCTTKVTASSNYPIIILSCYNKNMKIGDSFYLVAFSSNGGIPTFKSTNSKIAAVTSLGEVTARSPGTCKINVKDKRTEISCKVTVSKTKIVLSQKSVSIEHNETLKLNVTTSTKGEIIFKSNKSSVATVDENGTITGNKPGDAIITVKADTSTAQCKVKVKSPVIKLNHSSLTMYKGQSKTITADVSSGIPPIWKTNRSSVATIDENGCVTAVKHGTAIISATVDGIKKICEVTVKPPVIKLNKTSVTLKAGEKITLEATVSSGNTPKWISKKTSIATVDQKGVIKAKKAGEAIITVSEDGTQAICIVTVTPK